MEPFVDNAVPQRPGELLAAERDRQGLSRADVAQRLHMSVSQVEALEAGDYARLPRGPFLRGFFRNYAKLLNLAPDSVLSMLAEAGPREAAPRIVVPSQNIRFDPVGERLSSPYVKAASLAAVVLAIGFAAMYWWLFIRTAPASAPRKPAAVASAPNGARTVPAAGALPASSVEGAAPPLTLPGAAAPKAEGGPPDASKMEPGKVEPAKVEPPKVEPAKVELAKAPPVSSEPGSRLRFSFAGESWVEVRDARGRVLLSGLNPPGSEAEVSGRPPFRVTVGNAAAVRLYQDGRPFDLAPHTRESVARFSIE